MVKHIGTFLLISVATYAGSTVLQPIAIAGCEPDIGILAMALIVSIYKPTTAILWGFYSGLLIDCLNPDFMGAGTSSRSITTAIMCLLHNKLNVDHPIWYGIIIFLVSVVDKTIYAIAIGWRERFFHSLIRFFVPSAIYNAILAMLIISIIGFLNKRKHGVI